MSLIQLDSRTWENTATREADPSWNLPKMIHRRAREYPGQVAIERRNAVGEWTPMTINAFAAHIDDTARGLIGLGVKAGDQLTQIGRASCRERV